MDGKLNRREQLLKLFADLSPEDQHALLAFAAFLAERPTLKAIPNEGAIPQASATPKVIPRPPGETVVGAIKRLSLTYPMLDRSTMFNEVSALMSQHIMQGRPAPEVIDELEAVFARQYYAWSKTGA